MRRTARLRLTALALAFLASPALATPNFTTKEAGIRISSAVLQAEVPTGGGAYPARFYYIRGSSQVFSATTTDGLTFTEDAGVRLSSLTVPSIDIAISSITGLSILPLNGGGFRMLYSVIGTTGAFRVYSATSADGLAWANDTGTAVNVDNGLTFAQYPSLLDQGSGDWHLYLIENSVFGNQLQNHEIFVATSTNYGRNWTVPVPAFAAEAGQVSAVKRTDGFTRLYYSAPPSVGVSTDTQILSALSTTSGGTSFSAETGVRLSTTSGLGSIDFPLVVRSTDNFRWRLYYDFKPFQPVLPSTADVYSAVTDVPDAQTISPNSVLRTQATVSTVISGEVFSPSASAQLTLAGQAPITGTVAYVNDQTLDVTFPVLNQTVGTWNVVVTDSNGQQGAVPGGFLIDFPGGNINMIDNLIRPRNGTKTQIQVSTFDDGQVTVKLFTIDGRPISTLFDGFEPAGTHTFLWDGTTASGRLAASGVYLVRVVGPKLNAVNKIVLIK